MFTLDIINTQNIEKDLKMALSKSSIRFLLGENESLSITGVTSHITGEHSLQFSHDCDGVSTHFAFVCYDGLSECLFDIASSTDSNNVFMLADYVMALENNDLELVA